MTTPQVTQHFRPTRNAEENITQDASGCLQNQSLPNLDWTVNYHYRSQAKLREGNVFTGICLSVCGRGGR